MYQGKNVVKLGIAVLLLCICIALYSGSQLISNEKEEQKGIHYYNQLEPIDTEQEQESKSQLEQADKNTVIIDFPMLSAINSDIVAWIYNDQTVINYPVVQGEDNFYYLNKLFDRSNHKNGTPFLDVRCSSDFSDKHSIIYGHNMKNGSMFGSILQYKDQEYYKKHPKLQLITPDHKYVVELFSAYVCSIEEDAWKVEFADDLEYLQWIENSKRKSIFQSEVNPTINSRILTLSTCAYDFPNARFVVMGVLKEVS